jgi:hypothetical protein
VELTMLRKILIVFLTASIFISCTSPYYLEKPYDTTQSIQTLNKINYLGAHFNSEIHFVDGNEVSTDWLNVAGDTLIYVREELSDTLNVLISELDYIEIENSTRSTIVGLIFGIVFTAAMGVALSLGSSNELDGYSILIAFALSFGLGYYSGSSINDVEVFYFQN